MLVRFHRLPVVFLSATCGELMGGRTGPRPANSATSGPRCPGRPRRRSGPGAV